MKKGSNLLNELMKDKETLDYPGTVVGGPANRPAKQYKVRVVGEDIEVIG